MRQALGFLDCQPDIAGPEPQDVAISIEPKSSYFQIVSGGSVLRDVMAPSGALHFLHLHLFAKSIEDRPGAALIHAASVRRHGKRILLIGSKGTGKTTLTLKLISAGFELEGDEHVFLEGSTVVARPRACRVKPGTLDLVPEFAECIRRQPTYSDSYAGTIYNVDPSKLGRPWRIEAGTVDHAVVLQANHGGYSSLRPLSAGRFVGHVLQEIALREKNRGGAMSAIAGLANSAQLYDLSLGDLRSAIDCLDRIAAT
jgi:hypothetical protein